MPTDLIADASPQKDFLIHQLTRDITLRDCILDLVDNSVDGIQNYFARAHKRHSGPKPYTGYRVDISFSDKTFRIVDNCEGIPIEVAKHYAFTFGRAQGAPEVSGSIGRYGIGMKRAIFKLGERITILSSTRTEAFRLPIDVKEWENKPKWEFSFQEVSKTPEPGTSIHVEKLRTEIADELARPNFEKDLERALERDYSFIIEKGFAIKLNRRTVKALGFTFKCDHNFKPYRVKFPRDNVDVDIVGGMIAPPPTDTEAGAPLKDPERSGWFVVCNDRVVLDGDKSARTGWGTDHVPFWHPQYNGFCGIAHLEAVDSSMLPWTTTKRDVDETSAIYQEVLKHMRDASRQYTDYTNSRKGHETYFRALEKQARSVSLDKIPTSALLHFPRAPGRKKSDLRHISYSRPEKQILAVAKALGSVAMSYREVGEKTFDDFYSKRAGGED